MEDLITCPYCNQTKNMINDFHLNRKKCKECYNTHRKELREYKKELERFNNGEIETKPIKPIYRIKVEREKECMGFCGRTLPLSSYPMNGDYFRKECKDCYNVGAVRRKWTRKMYN